MESYDAIIQDNATKEDLEFILWEALGELYEQQDFLFIDGEHLEIARLIEVLTEKLS